MDHEFEPPPYPELMPATESTLEPIVRFSEGSGLERQFSDEPVE